MVTLTTPECDTTSKPTSRPYRCTLSSIYPLKKATMYKMQAPEPLPQYVYKIIPTAPPSPIPSPYPLSALDEKDGFVHLSTSWQVRLPSPPRHLVC